MSATLRRAGLIVGRGFSLVRMRVLYPGSFDPFHEGHLDVVRQAARLFDEVVVAAVANPAKPTGTGLSARAAAIRGAVEGLENVSVVSHGGSTAELARSVRADALVRGATREHRTELAMARLNEATGGIPTVFVPASVASRHVSSTAIRLTRPPSSTGEESG
jgi:pantetheine-phosphate adenylyltransferase